MNFSEQIKETSRKHYNVRDEYKKNSPEDNKTICYDGSLPYAVGTLSITGDLNVGIMIRTASLLGARSFFIFGRKKYDRRSTVGAEFYIDVHKYDSDVDSISDACINHGYFPVLVEHGGIPITERGWQRIVCDSSWDNTFPILGDPLFLFGSEGSGIPEEIIDYFVEKFNSPVLSIPQKGVLRSFNVSTSMSIVCWEYSKWVNEYEW